MASSLSGSSTQNLLSHSVLVSQGAEAKVYLGVLHPPLVSSEPAIYPTDVAYGEVKIFLKHRFPKKYRHSTLDKSLTKSRIGAEARALARCARLGVAVPGVRFLDLEEGVLGMEWIDGHSVRALLSGLPEDEEEGDTTSTQGVEKPDMATYGVTDEEVMSLIGAQLAKMHKGDIIHGDLTTSNMMLRRTTFGSSAELIMIDFGLAYNSNLVEDKAVDLYVLERALGATHPDAGRRFKLILAAYAATMGAKDWPKIEARLADVRMRGRKRSMVG